MTWKEKLKIVVVTSTIWTVCLSSCAGLTIKTWYLDGKDLSSLVRRNRDGSVRETKSYVDANGYLCYSPDDDEAWRNRLAACCSKANMLE